MSPDLFPDNSSPTKPPRILSQDTSLPTCPCNCDLSHPCPSIMDSRTKRVKGTSGRWLEKANRSAIGDFISVLCPRGANTSSWNPGIVWTSMKGQLADSDCRRNRVWPAGILLGRVPRSNEENYDGSSTLRLAGRVFGVAATVLFIAEEVAMRSKSYSSHQ